MTKKQHKKIVREGNYLAEVNIELLETGEGWTPYLSVEDALKLDDVREALREKDIKSALKNAKVYFLKPIAV